VSLSLFFDVALMPAGFLSSFLHTVFRLKFVGPFQFFFCIFARYLFYATRVLAYYGLLFWFIIPNLSLSILFLIYSPLARKFRYLLTGVVAGRYLKYSINKKVLF